MAVDALEYEDENEEVEANPAVALEEILENPERLRDLDLDAFADELERQVNYVRLFVRDFIHIKRVNRSLPVVYVRARVGLPITLNTAQKRFA